MSSSTNSVKTDGKHSSEAVRLTGNSNSNNNGNASVEIEKKLSQELREWVYQDTPVFADEINEFFTFSEISRLSELETIFRDKYGHGNWSRASDENKADFIALCTQKLEHVDPNIRAVYTQVMLYIAIGTPDECLSNKVSVSLCLNSQFCFLCVDCFVSLSLSLSPSLSPSLS
jgi:N1221-like protein